MDKEHAVEEGTAKGGGSGCIDAVDGSGCHNAPLSRGPLCSRHGELSCQKEMSRQAVQDESIANVEHRSGK